MERTPLTSKSMQCAVCVLLTVLLTGCGSPMIYHFKHHHRPFEAISRSNKTYFHSQQSGRIIEKDPCATYCEPGCFGYEPTTWTRWPAQCAGNCPIQGEIISEQLMPIGDEHISDGSIIVDGDYTESYAAPRLDEPKRQPPAAPTPAAPRDDEIRVPSIPADSESAIPSPSDSTKRTRRRPIRLTPVETEVKTLSNAGKSSETPIEDELVIKKVEAPPSKPGGTARKFRGLKLNKPKLSAPLATTLPQPSTTKVEKAKSTKKLAISPTMPDVKLNTKISKADVTKAKAATDLVAEKAMPKSINRKAKSVSVADSMPFKVIAPSKSLNRRPTAKTVHVGPDGDENRMVVKSLPPTSKTLVKQNGVAEPNLRTQATSASRRVATMKVSDQSESTLRFAAKPKRKPLRISAISTDESSTTIRFR